MWKSILISALFCSISTFELSAQECSDTCIIYVPKTAFVDGDCSDCHQVRIGTDCDFSEFNFFLFDRWGTIVFETKDPDFVYEPVGLKEGAYTYQIKSETKSGCSKKQTGNILIIK